MMKNLLYQKDIISITDLSINDIELILTTAEKLKNKPVADLLRGKILATCFYEASTRTRLSFESAMFKLGGNVIGFSDTSSTSVKKGETLSDTMRIMAGYADIIALRHPSDGAARLATTVADKPVINAGDGANQHPTQTLLDLFTIKECQGKLNGLNIALAGDLKYGRTVHSLVCALQHFKVRLFFISTEALMIPDSVCDLLRGAGIKFSFHREINEVLKKVDVLYMTRLQKERFDPAEFQLLQQKYSLTADSLGNAKENLKILHPLPRVNEIDVSIDKTQHAYYFEQAQNGVAIRKALLALLLNENLKGLLS